jgi:CheY-like chemotaxis protein
VPDPGSTPNQRPVRVLLVEDNADARQALARYLELYGMEVVAVGDRPEVLAALADPAPIDAVVTDLMLPDIDGREIADLVRSRDPAPLTVLVTGWDNALDESEFAAHGIQHLLYKPLDLPALVRLLVPPSPDAGVAGGKAASAIDRPERKP